MSKRTIIIGDIHGCNRELCALLDQVCLGDSDCLILLGDLFDRGSESREVFRTVKHLAEDLGDRFVLLRGNHEDFLLQEKLTLRQRMIWDRVGRGATVESFRRYGERMEDTVPWIQEHCQMFYREDGLQCVHAGLLVDPIETNDTHTLIHDHGIVLRNCYTGPLTVVGHIALEAPTWFAGDEKTAEELAYIEWNPLPTRGVICIDTGAGKGGWLTAMIVEHGEDGQRFRLERASCLERA